MTNLAMYATAILCMDGAYIGGVRKQMKKQHNIQHVDIIPQPGIVKILAEAVNLPRIQLIEEMIEISVVNHGSRAIAIAAHHNCLGNPVDKDCQLKQLPRARETVKKLVQKLGLDCLGIEFSLFWINEKGLPEEVHSSERGRIFSRELVFIPTTT